MLPPAQLPIVPQQRQSVQQTSGILTVTEGEPFFLNCSYEANSTPYLFWYRQYGNQKPEQILTAYKSKSSNNHFQEGKFSTTLVLESQNSVPLNIRSVSLLDAAVYFCALNPTIIHGLIVLTVNSRLLLSLISFHPLFLVLPSCETIGHHRNALEANSPLTKVHNLEQLLEKLQWLDLS
uniref:Ig-like domain-containing protein n=1 Tax=Naja naja TaxID=35670 RepID=A0A8C6VTV0_NAJNA